MDFAAATYFMLILHGKIMEGDFTLHVEAADDAVNMIVYFHILDKIEVDDQANKNVHTYQISSLFVIFYSSQISVSRKFNICVIEQEE